MAFRKKFDLVERTFLFAKNVACRTKQYDKTTSNTEYRKQLIRSSGSIAANYLEACEAVSHKDFLYRIRLSRKEARESALWISLLIETNEHNDVEMTRLHTRSY